jgi:CheY-like chemotaxis protein
MSSYGMESLRVLVVDDSPYMIAIVETLLGAMGVREVRGVDAGQNVLAEIRSFEPDLIVIDHMMKPKSGLEVIRDIRDLEDDPLRFIPIILMTGYTQQGVVTQARFRAGADAVLIKPVSARRLYDCIVALHESTRTFVRTRSYFGPDRRAADRPFEGLDKELDGPWSPYASPGIPEKLQDDSLELALVSVDPESSEEDEAAGQSEAPEPQENLASAGGRGT